MLKFQSGLEDLIQAGILKPFKVSLLESHKNLGTIESNRIRTAPNKTGHLTTKIQLLVIICESSGPWDFVCFLKSDTVTYPKPNKHKSSTVKSWTPFFVVESWLVSFTSWLAWLDLSKQRGSAWWFGFRWDPRTLKGIGMIVTLGRYPDSRAPKHPIFYCLNLGVNWSIEREVPARTFRKKKTKFAGSDKTSIFGCLRDLPS